MRIGGQNTVENDPISGARRGATHDDPPPLLPSTRRGLYGHSDRAGKVMRPQVGENCVMDTTEEEGDRVV